MILYVDANTNKLVNDALFLNPLLLTEFKRGDATSIELRFTNQLIADPGRMIKFGIKAHNDFDATEYLVYTNTYTTLSNSQSYFLNPSFNTTTLSAILSGDTVKTTASLEITWSDDSGVNWSSTQVVDADIYNDLIKGGETFTIPESGFYDELISILASYTEQININTGAGLTINDGGGLALHGGSNGIVIDGGFNHVSLPDAGSFITVNGDIDCISFSTGTLNALNMNIDSIDSDAVNALSGTFVNYLSSQNGNFEFVNAQVVNSAQGTITTLTAPTINNTNITSTKVQATSVIATWLAAPNTAGMDVHGDLYLVEDNKGIYLLGQESKVTTEGLSGGFVSLGDESPFVSNGIGSPLIQNGYNSGIYINGVDNCPIITAGTNSGITLSGDDSGITVLGNNSDLVITNSDIIMVAGNIGVQTPLPTQPLDVNHNSIRIRTTQTPSGSAAAGDVGSIAWDANYLYVRTAGGWKRAAISFF